MPCYNVDPPPPPDNTPDPKNDNRSGESKEKPQVNFAPWPNEADNCCAEQTVAAGSQQMPAGIGAPAGSPAKAAAPAPGALPGAGPAGPGGAGPAPAQAPAGGAAAAGGASAGPEGAPPSGSGEVKAMSQAASAGADEITAGASGPDAQMGSAERERDAAVSDHHDAQSSLDEVASRAQPGIGRDVPGGSR